MTKLSLPALCLEGETQESSCPGLLYRLHYYLESVGSKAIELERGTHKNNQDQNKTSLFPIQNQFWVISSK